MTSLLETGSFPTSGQSRPNPGIYLVAVADKSFQKRYAPIFQAMDIYANKYGYKWAVIDSPEARDDDRYDCSKYLVYFFKKHCIVAQWTLRNTNSGDRVFVFDSDVVPYRTQTPLDVWVNLFFENDVVFYDRCWNSEVTAGNYMIQNNPQALDFLVGWADWEFEVPPGFSSADNGAIHVHLLRVLGLDSNQVCHRQYKNLTALVTNLEPYWSFVKCTREDMPAGVYTNNDISIRIMPKTSAWVVDGVFDSVARNDFNEGNNPAPVFHHGVKLSGTETEDAEKYNKYGLQHVVVSSEDAIEYGLQHVIAPEDALQCPPIQEKAQCEAMGTSLGVFESAGECSSAVNSSLCEDAFMFSSSYHDWGCHCCQNSDNKTVPHDLWSIYSLSNCSLEL